MVRLLSSIGRQSISIGIRVSELDSNNRLSPSSRPLCISFYSLLFSYSFPSLLVLRFSYPPMIPKFLATVSFTRFARARARAYTRIRRILYITLAHLLHLLFFVFVSTGAKNSVAIILFTSCFLHLKTVALHKSKHSVS